MELQTHREASYAEHVRVLLEHSVYRSRWICSPGVTGYEV